ncbi:MAG TPA: TIGR03986 family CRISPR-associated RAMP protein, partial [Longimicrobium sp.]|nr:TIGR03986 family CRISPR-associated RAMP protein [Longimicrobium sp.]
MAPDATWHSGRIGDIRPSFVKIELSSGRRGPEFTPSPEVWSAPDGRPAEKGDEVEFQLDVRGKKAVSVRLVRRARTAVPVTPVAAPADTFFNPYNFVRALKEPKVEPSGVDVRLLGRCPPPPLDRYVALSGVIRCSIEAVSPVFVSDSHDVEGARDTHRTFRHFRVPGADGKGIPAIPASSLRGVVRSVFEAATNSCWEHVADRRLSRRLVPNDARLLVPARLTGSPGAWKVELLTGESGYRENGPSGALYAGWVLQHRSSANGRRSVRLPPGLKHGEPCHARMVKHNIPGRVTFWNVEALARSQAEVMPGGGPDEQSIVREGYYFFTGRNIDRKHDERFFFAATRGDFVPVADECVVRYVDLLKDYRENSKLRSDQEEAGLEVSRFVNEDRPRTEEECDGELVYAWVTGSGDGRRVKGLAPVSVPRLFYDRTIRERMPDFRAVKPCSEVNRGKAEVALCPACRVFGWVAADDGALPGQGALRSRVRFGDARFPDGPMEESPRTLDILSAPKPTTVRFYLVRKNENLEPEPDEKTIDYDSGNVVLRGRKFYRGRREAKLHTDEEATNQNRTLADHLKAGAASEFEVRFENLAPLELGALLWSLGLEKGWVHRLGFGKPLGMGAVRIGVREVSVLGPGRYAPEGGDSQVLDNAAVEGLRRRFRAGMEARYGGAWRELRNVADLAALLRESAPEQVDYPRLSENGKSYEW